MPTQRVNTGRSSQFVDSPISPVAGATTLEPTDETIFADASGGAFTITLPSAALVVPGKAFAIKKVDTTGNFVTIATTSSQTIDGDLTALMFIPNEVLVVVSDGANWQILQRYNPNDPAKQLLAIYDDFMSSDINACIGQTNWQPSTGGTGASAIAGSATLTNATNQGIVVLTTGTDATGRSSIFKEVNQLLLGGGPILIEALINVGSLGAAADDYIIDLGFGDLAASGELTNGVYFSYERAVSTNWLMTTASAGSRTKTSSGVAVATGWVKLGFRINPAASSVEYFINGVSVGTVVTNIPTAVRVGPVIRATKSSGATSRIVAVDYFTMQTVMTTAR